jgi:TetR/AcrR family transcriptional repressor of mexJK operon
MEAAMTVFLRNGYLGASMDEVAAQAGVSKQTVYKHFADKERLFHEIVLGTTDTIDALFQAAAADLGATEDLEAELGRFARRFIVALTQPELLRLRRLIIAEADRFPELGRTWYGRGFERVLASFEASLRRLDERGLLAVDDPALAAAHFAGLLLWIPVNRVMFRGGREVVEEAEVERMADAGVRVFLAAYGRRPAG